MKRFRLSLVAVLYVVIAFSGAALNIVQAQAATTTIGNSNLTNLSDAQKYVKANQSGYQTYIKGNIILYHPNAGAAWNMTSIPTNVLTKNNDGSADEKNACVDISDSSYRFVTEIWANRGGGCGTNGTTSSGYSGGQVNVNPPDDFPVFLFVEDIDGLKDRQHITFTSSAIDQLYIPATSRSYSVSGGNDLISNGANGAPNCSGQAWCNAIVLLRANSFNIKAGSKDGDSVMRVRNNTSLPYVTLTLNPNGGSVVDNELQSDGTIGDESTLWSHISGVNVLREYQTGTTANEYPTPTRANYTFLGWYDAVSGGNRISSLPINSDMTLYAHWDLIPSNSYELTPVSLGAPSAVNTGDQATFTTSVSKSTSYISNATDWVVRKIIVPVGVTPPSGSRTGVDSTQFDCNYYIAKGMQCSQLPSDSGSRVFSTSSSPIGVGSSGTSGSYTETLNYPSGFRVCYAVMVNSYTQAAKPNYKEAVGCVVVAKYPALQVLNGDIRVGGASANPTCSLKTAMGANGDPYSVLVHDYISGSKGSYGQYAGFALGEIANFGSNNQYYSGNPLTRNLLFGSSGYQPSYTKNGFFNGNPPLLIGAPTFCLTDIATIYNTSVLSVTNTNSDITIGNLSSLGGSIAYNFTTSNKTLTINNSAPVGPGKRILIYVKQSAGQTGNSIVINNNITYTGGGYGSTSDLPQVVVIADADIDIRIAAGVTEVDGIYSSGGNIFTCDNFDGVIQMTQDQCNLQLRVNGALVAAGRVLPYRTYGYDSSSDTNPAEIFNLTPDTLIGDYERARSLPIITTDNLSELPTRL